MGKGLKTLKIKGTKKQTRLVIFRVTEEVFQNIKKLSKDCKSMSQYINKVFATENIKEE